MSMIRILFFKLVLAVFAGLLVNSAGSLLLSSLLLKINVKAAEVESIVTTFFPLSGYLIIASGLIFSLSDLIEPILMSTRKLRVSGIEIQLSEEFNQARKRAEAEPEKAKPAWDLARVKLELYFDRNLKQINYIFWLSVLVMIVGFAFILFGAAKIFDTANSVPNTDTINPAVVTTVAGVITEFIGATFLFIYKSTIQQASNYTQTLERINSVGMAMQIVDSISDESKELQDKTKAELVKLLLAQGSEFSSIKELK